MVSHHLRLLAQCLQQEENVEGVAVVFALSYEANTGQLSDFE